METVGGVPTEPLPETEKIIGLNGFIVGGVSNSA